MKPHFSSGRQPRPASPARPPALRAAALAAALALSCVRPAWPAGPPPGAGERPGVFQPTPEERARLREALASRHAAYDPAARMLREPFHSPGYHTTLQGGTVHSTRSSLAYAVALLDTGEEPLRLRAEDILRAVIALQDQDPRSRTYGIWPWFLEEPLERMSPPDWNWADFCGVHLLQVALDHRARLSPEVAALVDEAIGHAARSIQRRNVGPAYTNIALMGTYVTLVAGEFYGWTDLRDYGLARLRRFHAYTMEQGAFTEYNSPTYTVVALSELARLRRHARDPEARRLAEALYRLGWEDVAAHFHAPTRQWAGPHSRCYNTLLARSTLAFLQRALGGQVDFGAEEPGLADARLPAPCPPEFVEPFKTPGPPRDVVRTYLRAQPPVVGVTRLEPAFALGTINRGDLWNQRRALLAYWGSAAEPSYLHLRFLRDDYDFAAAQFFSAQRGGDVLAAINFATDGGNTHVSLDRLSNGVVRARSLRLRFEFGGAAGRLPLEAPSTLKTPARLSLGQAHLALLVPCAWWGAAEGRWTAGRAEGKAWLDVVLYEGPERVFRLGEMDQAVAGLALRLRAEPADPPAPSVALREGRLAMEWAGMRLQIPVRPDKAGVLQRAAAW